MSGNARIDLSGCTTQRDPNAPQPQRMWKAMWYVEWREWMLGVKWGFGPGARIKVGPFGVTFFRTIRHAR